MEYNSYILRADYTSNFNVVLERSLGFICLIQMLERFLQCIFFSGSFYICQYSINYKGSVIGFIRVSRCNGYRFPIKDFLENYEVTINIFPLFRNRGYGRAALLKIAELYPSAIALVRINNVQSNKLFDPFPKYKILHRKVGFLGPKYTF